jgi:2-dehydropantoate 2-reductase
LHVIRQTVIPEARACLDLQAPAPLDVTEDVSMRVAVVGAGAVGLLYGGWLQQGGADVTFVARGRRLDDLVQNPVRARGRLAFNLNVKAIGAPADMAPVDVILLCVKLYDLQAAAEFALPALKRGGTLIGIQNGVNIFSSLQTLLPKSQIAVGPVYVVAKSTGPATVAYAGLDRIILGNPEADLPDEALELLRIWQSAGVDATHGADIRSVLWQKFIGVATGSAINCLTRLPAGVVYHDEHVLRCVKQSISEVIDVGRALGIDIPPLAAETTLSFLKTFPFDGVASMRLDLDAGQKLELDGLSGEVVRLGELSKVPTPFHRMAYDLLRPFRDGSPLIRQ